jgi:hypothetical protein
MTGLEQLHLVGFDTRSDAVVRRCGPSVIWQVCLAVVKVVTKATRLSHFRSEKHEVERRRLMY